ncbi:hypothetical protein BDV96DRAFT_583992 [Lophiotrema nucula]|uniref:FAD-binding domain-containing protein n=1 Tax=Lophiotrema nucula TaxID=690887 RepID=A0A6A5YTB2_9PLEO|nr:hypothetical protein BDV96DRAFT_583992 [Lophiotrema nucula]
MSHPHPQPSAPMPPPRINIIGAGIAGLTLGRCLVKRGVSVCLFEKAPSGSRHNYGITLYASSYRPLLDELGIDEATFKRRVAVDRNIGGFGVIDARRGDGASFRANRGKLEHLLQEGLDIQWGKNLFNFEEIGQKSITLCLRAGRRIWSKCTVAADGPNSIVRRLLLPEEKLTVLPFVVFNGKRSVERERFEEVYAPAMKISNVIELKRDDVLLQISINNHGAEDGRVSISWTYSRPALTNSPDPLHRPNRKAGEAGHIPSEFFDEIATLKTLPQPFAEVFKPDAILQGRVLHWLMRTSLTPLPSLKDLAEKHVYMIGEAVHAEPILGGEGANTAIVDGMQLAACIAENRPEGISAWYESRYPAWEESVRRSERAIKEMHGSEKAVL